MADTEHPVMQTPRRLEVCENGRVYGTCSNETCSEHIKAVENLGRYGIVPTEHWHVVKEREEL